MYKKILVPLDGSKRAEKILPHAADLAERYQAEVILLTVNEYRMAFGIEGAFVEYNRKDFDAQTDKTRSYLEKVAAGLAKKKIACEVRVANGSAVDAIIATAEKEKADLIAMASHGGGGLTRVFYGSVAAGVLNRVDRPLLIVRSRSKD